MGQWKKYKMEGLNLNNTSALDFIPSVSPDMKKGETFMYLDPPYPRLSRKTEAPIYAHELTYEDHIQLLDMMLTVNFNCMISTYPNELYDNKLQKWRKIDFQSTTRGASATEVLYMNYSEPNELHDYQYLGDDSWDRQRIKRKIEGKVKSFAKLPILEQRALMEALNKEFGLEYSKNQL